MDVHQMVCEISQKVDEMTIDAFAICGFGEDFIVENIKDYREWRHFFWLRAARKTGPAHPQMEELTVPLLDDIALRIPVVFDDIVEKCAEWRSQKNP